MTISSDYQAKIYKRTLIIIVISQVLGGAGLAAGITVGALLAQDMLGTDSFAGIPTALFTLGSALAAFLVGKSSQAFGRRIGLGLGFITGGIGAIGVVIAAVLNHIPLLFIALFIYGAGTATNLQARYAGTDLAHTKQRATAVSIAMVATTFGAVAGPNLVEVMGNVALRLGIPMLAGPFILATAAFILAGLFILVFLRPDPLLLAEKIEKETVTKVLGTEENNQVGITLGALVMVVAQIVMVAIMTMTPVYMGANGFTLQQIGLVIGLHVGSMYLPSLITGVLVDKIGRLIMVLFASLTLFLSGILAAFAPAESFWLITLALALLGLGWNFGLISGTALIVDSTRIETRAKTQGAIDVWIAFAGALGGALSGVIVAQTSFLALSLIGGIFSLSLIPLLYWARKGA